MKVELILHILRNPYGKSDKQISDTRLAAADKIEELHDAYLNMKKFAKSKGLDTATRG